jgi:hypothetical protein
MYKKLTPRKISSICRKEIVDDAVANMERFIVASSLRPEVNMARKYSLQLASTTR